MILFIFLCVLFVCWGSFLNSLAYRITYDKPLFAMRSYCPVCTSKIAWYDNIPLLSWFLLRGKCRHCKNPISYLYPLIEVLAGVVLTALFFFLYDGVWSFHFFAKFATYFLFFSALIASTRTDLQEMVIPQMFTIWLIPIGILSSFMGVSGIVVYESVLGALLGYGVLWLIAFLYKRFAYRDGLGHGDMELLSMIGAFLGIAGVWFTLLLGSLIGLLAGGGYIWFAEKGRYARIPFGPFLALGATMYFFFQKILFYLVF